VDLLHIPYKGVAPALVDVISGQVSISFPSILTSLPQVRSGRLRALAVSGARRSATLPELPTMMEAGVKDYESATWYGIVAPAATSPEIVSKLNAEIAAILRQPDTRERIARDGADPVGNTPQQFGAFMKSEIEKWRKVIRAAGIQPG
jgi:tripartite-type tricarboxylate transporter receptor subunit TctC